MIDTQRLAALNAELAGVQDEEHALVRRRLAILDEVAGLNASESPPPDTAISGVGSKSDG